MRMTNDERITNAVELLEAALDRFGPEETYDGVEARARLHDMGIADPLEDHEEMAEHVRGALFHLTRTFDPKPELAVRVAARTMKFVQLAGTAGYTDEEVATFVKEVRAIVQQNRAQWDDRAEE